MIIIGADPGVRPIKVKYNPNILHRRSIRYKNYDYSLGGAFFITINCQDSVSRFGKIWGVGQTNGSAPTMRLNDAGLMIEKWWFKIPEKFSDIELDVYQIMPNHFHGILINNDNRNEKGEHMGSPLQTIIQWFKTMTTNEYIRCVKTLNWNRFEGKLWQRNYYDHIIRNLYSYQMITLYIIENPERWYTKYKVN
ncbi:transposase [soil metagenome]